MRVTFLRGTKAPLVKGSWRGAPEGLARRSEKAPLSGELAAKQTERLSLSGTTSPSRRSAEPPPLEGEAFGRAHTQKGGRSCGLLFVKDVFNKREMNYLEMS